MKTRGLFLIKGVSALVSSIMLTASALAQTAFSPQELVVGESFVNPLGYDLSSMSFSWQLPPLRNNMAQSAYRIVVASSEDGFDVPVWDSGKVASGESVKVPYGGRKFASAEKLFWRVKVWDESLRESDWSATASFETGLLSNADWRAQWISTSEPEALVKVEKLEQKCYRPTYLRKEFDLKGEIESARLYVSCRGIFQIYANGKKVGNDYWGTGWTDYNKRIQANTYDVSALLKSEGKNAIGAIVADGWYAGRLGWNNRRAHYGKKPQLIAKLVVRYADGSVETVATDASWQSSYGAVTFADIYNGEEFDARLVQKGWNDVDFDASSWKPVAVENLGDSPLLEPRRNQPIVEKDSLVSLGVNKVAKGTFVFDLGQNMVGVTRIKIPSKAGMVVKIRYAEMLNKDGTLYTANYRSARSEDHYTCATNGVEEWQQAFTFHGFRYVELSGFDDSVEASPDWVTGVVLFNDMPLTGSFVCSSQKINKLQSCIQWGQRGNFFSVPTDCPQRDERLGWTGDAQVFCQTAAFNMDVSAFFAKWTRDLRDSQTADGRLPHVSPDILKDGGSAAWADAGVIVPWQMYLAYGDKKFLRENFEMMKGWISYQRATSDNFIRPEVGYGDWLQPNPEKGKHPASDAPKSLIGTAYFAHTADIVSRAAGVLGDGEAQKKYAEISRQVKDAFVKRFVSADGKIASDCQTVYLLALGFDILPENLRGAAFAHLLKSIERADWHLNTGFVGTVLLNEVLTKFGRNDIAYKLLNTETYPSWLYPINQGGTTMWERWNSYSHKDGFGDASMNSFNHYAYGAIGQWIYKNVAGIWLDESAAGYKNIIFAPKLGGGLTFASATHNTPYGLASSGWKIADGIMTWNVVIPPNATGTLAIPTKDLSSVKIDGARANLQSDVLHLQSGAYELSFNLKN